MRSRAALVHERGLGEVQERPLAAVAPEKVTAPARHCSRCRDGGGQLWRSPSCCARAIGRQRARDDIVRVKDAGADALFGNDDE